MKNLTLSLWFYLFAAKIFSQVTCDFYDDYSDPASWTNVYIYPGISPCSLDPASGTLEVASGQVEFTNVNDGNDTRIHKDLGFTLSNESWTANFEFTPTAIGAGGIPRVGHVIFALSAGTNCPFNDSTYHCEISDQDGITVWYLSEYSPVASTTGFYIYAKDGTSWVSSWGIDWVTAVVGQTYYLTLKRIATDFVTLEVYNDPARTDLEGSIDCFEIPDNVTDLHVLQHANAPWGYYMRGLTGTLDNTCIYNSITETAYLIGPDSLCSSEDGDYVVASGSGAVDWNLPPGVIYTVTGPNSIEITDWGGLGLVTITAEVTTACLTTILTYDVAVIAAITFTETINICENDTIIVFGDPVSDSGIFTEIIIGVGGCDSTHTIIVNAIDTLVTTETISICINDTIFIDGAAVSDPGIFIQNLFALSGCDSIHTIIVETIDTVFTNEIISICDTDTIFIDGAAVSDPGLFIQNLLTVSGCDSTHTIVVEIIDTIFSNEIITICEGETAIIFGNDESAAGNYTQSLYTLNGCDSSHTITLIIEPAIDVFFTSDTIICDITGITLEPVIIGTMVSVSWSPAALLTCADCINPHASPTENGWYYITVTDANGCVDVDSVYIMLDYLNTIIAPNAFSPNGDGINDGFYVLGPECELIFLRIYNRWGALIFESNDINIGWNGTYKSIPQEIGAYVYLAEGDCMGELKQLVGTITLVR